MSNTENMTNTENTENTNNTIMDTITQINNHIIVFMQKYYDIFLSNQL